MKLRYGLLGATILCAVSGLAEAQQTSGFYVGGAIGYNLLRDSDISGPGIGNNVEWDGSWAGLGSFGYGFGNGFRVEGEIGYRTNDVDNVSGGGPATGKSNAWSFMGNVLYDFNTGTALTPYIGVGLGGASVRFDDTGTFSGTRVDDSDMVFAYQGIAGLAYAFAPQLKLTLDYRYFGTSDPSFATNTNVGVDSEYRTHTVMLGLRYEFGAPSRPAQPAQAAPPAPPPPAPPPPAAAPPAPPPAPARQIQRSYLVFFDFDKSDITPEANRIIVDAAANAKTGNVSRINLTGHADRAGPEKYNMALSIRRANAVRDVLVRQGVPANQISVVGKGETQPLVPTADGVREPQNRRVEIVLQ
jgi:outer membrane protein OmpA-like peptidoglycan-associated protein